jgi:rhodanese-related sulfurtransferase
MKKIAWLFARSVLFAAACVLVGVVFNALRPHGIDLVAQSPYQIYVPCPESLAKAETVTTAAARRSADVLYLDARPVEDFERAHIKGAISFPYPVLEDPDAARVDALKTKGVPIVTYCDGGRSRFGEMMAKLLTELGVKNVTNLEGGLEAWRSQGGEIETGSGGADE